MYFPQVILTRFHISPWLLVKFEFYCFLLYLQVYKSCVSYYFISEECPPPTPVGSSYTFEHIVETENISEQGLRWSVRPIRFSKFFPKWTCFVDSSVPVCQEWSPAVLATIKSSSANMTDYGNGYNRSYFTINDVSIAFDGYQIWWILRPLHFGKCDLEVYGK